MVKLPPINSKVDAEIILPELVKESEVILLAELAKINPLSWLVIAAILIVALAIDLIVPEFVREAAVISESEIDCSVPELVIELVIVALSLALERTSL